MPLLLVFSTLPDHATAQRIAAALVEERLVACVNLVPGVHAIYRWQGRVESADEVLVVMKTTAEVYPQLEAKLKELHPYEVPEIIALPAERVEEAYAGWVNEMTKPG